MPVLNEGMEYIAKNNEYTSKSDYQDIKNKRNVQDMQRNMITNF